MEGVPILTSSVVKEYQLSYPTTLFWKELRPEITRRCRTKTLSTYVFRVPQEGLPDRQCLRGGFDGLLEDCRKILRMIFVDNRIVVAGDSVNSHPAT